MRYQLSSSELHQQQKRRQVAASSLPTIAIYAVDLAIPANIGGLLRVADSVACTEVVFVSTKLTTVNERKVHKASRGVDTKIVWSA
jgi:tRNA G18 (ribose-2'-O)-methylase SpoU